MAKGGPIQILVDKEEIKRMRKSIARVSGRPAIKLTRKANRAGLKPVLSATRKNVPVQSGKLKRALSIQNNKRVRGGFVVSKIWPRAKFKSKNLNDNAPIDISERRAGHPRTYAYYIEHGQTKAGGRLRKAGPANYLEKAYNSQKINAIGAFGKKFWQEIDKTITKGV